MFGDKFYKKLNKLMPWQQTLFSLALAERMYPNYQLFSEACDFGQAQKLRLALDTMWQYLVQRSMQVDLSAQLEEVESQIPEPQKFDSYGVYPAIDACVALCSAYNSVVCRIGDEAEEASKVSLNCVAGFVELLAERELSEEELYEQELVEQEMEFQVELLQRVAQPRDEKVIEGIRELATAQGVSNLGISLDS
ncbi:YjaG family protein [Dongshaea marina]|uniref:YjaG family protein n=1 Tax=Dongshaea marina TaxID=2047966 RepID=UPI000D3ED3C0|nr:YjaG family protein [Dongshaea marina]